MLKSILKNKILLLHILPLIIFLIIGGTVAAQAGQDQNWDLQNYHYYDPYALLNHREGIDYGVASIQTYVNPVADTVSYELITHFKPIVASSLLGAIQGLNVWMVYEISLIILSKMISTAKRRRLRIIYGLSFIIATASFFGAGNLGEVGETMVDNVVSILVLLSLLLVLLAVSKAHKYSPRKYLIIKLVGYLIMGIAVGLKLTYIPYAAGLLVIELLSYRGFWKFVKQCIYNGASLLIGMLASLGPWSYYLLKTYKSPLYPYYNTIFHSPYYPNVSFTDPRWFPTNVSEWLFYPIYFTFHSTYTAEVKFFDPRIGLLYVFVIVLGLYLIAARLFKDRLPKLKVKKEVAMLLVFTVVSYVLWEIQFSYYRYLIPTELLSILVLSTIFWSFLPKLKFFIPIVLILITFLLCITQPMDWGRIPWQKSFFGVELPANYLAHNSTVLMAGYDPISYLIPSFPHNIPFIRVGNDQTITPLGINGAKSRIAKQEKDGSAFYAIEVMDTTSAVQVSDFKNYGFKIISCKTIESSVSVDVNSNLNLYKLCKLAPTT